MDTISTTPLTADIRDLAEKAGAAASLMKLLANERRLLVLCELAAAGEMTVGELADRVGLSQSALSQHLSMMRDHADSSATAGKANPCITRSSIRSRLTS